jgi:hypothetical protein
MASPEESEAQYLREKFPYGHPDYIPMTLDELEVHSQKNHDYAREGNALGNFYRVSEALGAMGMNLTPTMVAIVYGFKQIDAAIQMMTKGYEGDIEGVDSRLRDAHIYLKLARILHKETH